MTYHILWGRKYVPMSIRIMGGTITECREALRFRTEEGGWEELAIYPEGVNPNNNRKEWQLPWQPRMINDRDPGTHGAVCHVCAMQYLDRLTRAAAYGENKYDSPHPGQYRAEARVIQWACAIGYHGRHSFGY